MVACGAGRVNAHLLTRAVACNKLRRGCMFDASASNLIGNLLFSSIGFVAFIYGKRLNLWKVMFGGLALMAIPYFIDDTMMLYLAGTAASAALFLLRS